PEVASRGLQLRVSRMREAVVERDVVGIVLSPVDVFEIAARCDHLVDDASLPPPSPRERKRHLPLLESRKTFVDVGSDLRMWIDRRCCVQRESGEKEKRELFHGSPPATFTPHHPT